MKDGSIGTICPRPLGSLLAGLGLNFMSVKNQTNKNSAQRHSVTFFPMCVLVVASSDARQGVAGSGAGWEETLAAPSPQT